MVSDAVVCDVVAERLRYAAEPFAPYRYDRERELLAHRLRRGLDVVSYQPYRALRLHRYPLGLREQRLHLAADIFELLCAAVHYVLLLEVRGELERYEVVHAYLPL